MRREDRGEGRRKGKMEGWRGDRREGRRDGRREIPPVHPCLFCHILKKYGGVLEEIRGMGGRKFLQYTLVFFVIS